MQKPFNLINILKIPARVDVFCLALLWLIIVLILGTLAQKDMGLYLAHEKYFSPLIWWVFGMFPVPAANLTMGFIFYGLVIKTFSERWTKQKIGTLVIHVGVLLLLFGGFITSKFSMEGNMVLAEGGVSNFIASYHDVELAVTDVSGETAKDVAIFPQKLLSSGNKLQHDALSFSVTVEKFCKNCAVSLKDDKSLKMPDRIILSDAPPEKIEEENVSGIRFILSGTKDNQDGSYLAFENIPTTSRITNGDKIYQISLRHKRTYLPFSLRLIDFEKQVHPGTAMARSYQSDVVLAENGVEWQSRIAMNEPLRYKGYTFYQSSVLTVNGEQMSVLAVVKNIGRLFPYISSIIICFGLLIHLFVRLPILINKKTITVALLILLFTEPAIAAEPGFDYKTISKVPIMHEGRIKPLDTFARVWLTSFSGREKLSDMTAMEWLMELVLTPEEAHSIPIFNIANPDVIHAIGLKTKQKHIYSFAELFPAMIANMSTIRALYLRSPNENSKAQRQLVEMVSAMGSYVELGRSLSFTPPDMDRTKDKVKPKLTLHNLTKEGRSLVFRVVPPQWDNETEVWFSPWGLLQAGQGSTETASFLEKWNKLIIAYKDKNIKNWNSLSNDILQQSYKMAGGKINKSALKMEMIYNGINLFKQSLGLYIASFIILLLGFIAFKKQTYIISAILMSIGILLHIIGIISRMYIMGRPPVTTLYESILFVGVIAVLFALFLERRNKNGLGLLIGSIIGSVLQFIGMKYSVEGDTMGMLAAVLDTNFWLATHVVTITIGYGFCIIGSILAHTYLMAKIIYPKNKEQQSIIFRNIMGTALIALFFSILGTILGGIWADYSWGRFWGWDPKENGAMLICLWLILLLHGVISKLLSPKLFAMGMVFTNIIVVLAWFGVNLLGVGLHSYGFTQNIALNIALFCGLEIIFVIICALILAKQKRIKRNV